MNLLPTQSYALSQIPTDELIPLLLLDKYPLYDRISSSDGNIHLLCLGNSDLAKRMVLSVLSIGQMIGSKLYIHVISENITQFQKDLLAQAPMLDQYTNISSNEILEECKYAHFTFEKTPKCLDERSYSKIAKKYSSCRYVICATEQSTADKMYAEQLLESFSATQKEETTLLYYSPDIKRGSKPQTKNNITIIPFGYCIALYKKELYELGEKAFRVNYMYEKQYNPHISKEKSLLSFSQNEYAQRSSLLSAIHGSYKLASLGLSIDAKKNHKSIVYLQNRIIEKYTAYLSDATIYAKLIELEHRRWMMAQISDGYKNATVPELEQYGFKYVNGRFNASFKCTDSSVKIHHCLVPCLPDVLRLPNDHEEWDRFESVEQILATKYDELDKISLTTHFLAKQRCERRTTKERIYNILAEISETQHLCVPNDDDLNRTIELFTKFIKEEILLHKSTSSVSTKIQHIHSEFSSRNLNIDNYINQLTNELAIYGEFSAYKDYKASDETIINNLLWILYAKKICVIKQTTPAVISNIAVSLIIEPEKTIYLGSPLPHHIIEFFLKHGNNTILTSETCDINSIKKTIRKVESLVESEDDYRFVIDVTDSSPMFVAAAIKISEQKKNIGVVAYNASDAKLINVSNFDEADIYKLTTSISANEVFELHGAKPKNEHDTYMLRLDPYMNNLWGFYQNHKKDWEMISTFFSIFARGSSEVYMKNWQPQKPLKWTVFKRQIPASIFNASGIQSILERLERVKIIKSIRLVETEGYNDLSFEYCESNFNMLGKLKYLFNTLDNKRLECDISNNPDGSIKIDISSRLRVNLFNQNNEFEDRETKKAYQLEAIKLPLEELKELGLIQNLKFEASDTDGKYTIEFVYPSTAIKDCLTTAGNILEAKVWHSANETGFFDSIQSNFSFVWQSASVSNELDVVMTKGMTTLVCSCKTSKMCKEHLYEIESLARRFSVNSKPIIIYSSDQSIEDGKISNSTKAVIERAKEMGVYLIDKDILNTNLSEELIRIATC